MSVCHPNNVRRAVQTDPTFLRYASGNQRTKEMLGCWLSSLTNLKLCTTTPNNMQQGVQRDETCNIQQCRQLLANNVASVGTGL